MFWLCLKVFFTAPFSVFPGFFCVCDKFVLSHASSEFRSKVNLKWQTMLPFTQMMDYVLNILLKWWTMSLHQFTQMIDYVLIILLKWQTKSLSILFYSDDRLRPYHFIQMTDYVLTILLKWQTYSDDRLCPYHFTQMTDYVFFIFLKWQTMSLPIPFYSNDRLCPYHFTQVMDYVLTIFNTFCWLAHIVISPKTWGKLVSTSAAGIVYMYMYIM